MGIWQLQLSCGFHSIRGLTLAAHLMPEKYKYKYKYKYTKKYKHSIIVFTNSCCCYKKVKWKSKNCKNLVAQWFARVMESDKKGVDPPRAGLELKVEIWSFNIQVQASEQIYKSKYTNLNLIIQERGRPGQGRVGA